MLKALQSWVGDMRAKHRAIYEFIYPLATIAIGWIGSTLTQDWWQRGGSANLILLLMTLLLFLLFIASRRSLFLLGELQHTIGVRAWYVPSDDSGEVYKAVRDLVLNAKHEIKALNSYLIEHDEGGRLNEVGAQRREAYYALLMEKARNDIKYTRIIQTQNMKDYCKELDTHDKTMMMHIRAMDIVRKEHKKTSLKQRGPVRMTNFVLIDDVYLIWQITEVISQGNRSHTKLLGAFLFDDPGMLITRHFKEYFENLDSQEDRRLELPPATQSAGKNPPPALATPGAQQRKA